MSYLLYKTHEYGICVLGDIPKSGKMFLEENLQDNKLATTTHTETETFMSENRSFYLDKRTKLSADSSKFFFLEIKLLH